MNWISGSTVSTHKGTISSRGVPDSDFSGDDEAGARVGGGDAKELGVTHACMVCVAGGDMCVLDAHLDQDCLVSAASLNFYA